MELAEEDELETRFDAAVRVIRSLPEDGSYQPSDDMMLMFYSYYKQAKFGPCNIPRPRGYWDTAGKAKWDAWNSLGNMSKTEAMQAYVSDIQLILETLPVTEEVSDLLEALGGVFFEEVEGGVQEEERPYAVAAEQMQTGFIQKPKMEGFGSLEIWADIQTKVPERKSNSMVMVGKEESKEGMKEARKLTEEEKVDCDEEEDSDDEEEDDERGTTAERKHPGPNRSRLRMEDPRCGSEVSSSNGSMEPSVSSVTYGTHSSLNSEEEEEELAYSKQPLPENRFQHLNGHLSEHLRATESDNEEFCDSIEHLVMEEESAVPRVHSSGRRASEAKRSLQRETNLNMDEDLSLLEDSPNREGLHTERRDSCWSMSGIGSRSSGLGSGSQLCTNENAAERWVMQSSTEAAASGDLNDYIAGVLTRLQEDMANVLQRLNTLEALTTIQTRSLSQARQNDSLSIARERPSWWPFHLCPATLVFSTVWPLIAHWLVQIYLQRRSRKMS
ncbi:acyl-CoA-binding domain-containing protein 5A isoform X1 [Esox lucius]|uniref:acyl-CoA-binding domain-containing protein 5A isoform X1 n=1 Tax=Esox lucius TaxID=8010 RepID=UPI001476DADA|nr:acyl-CoA-binding domain-containing protein 5A isoform X1 [Esox lucius]